MLRIYRSNRAELLAQLLAAQLQESPPPPFVQAQVMVNTWPTSRWLGEQIALHLEAGIAANLRFPFPSSQLRQLVDSLLAPDDAPPLPESPDPWRASQLVWPVLELLPELVCQPEALPLRQWLQQRGQGASLTRLERPLWQLGRAIADAFDDYTLYRPEMVAAWCRGERLDGRARPLPLQQHWQPLLMAQLAERLGVLPFGLRVGQAIERLRQWPAGTPLPGLPPGQPLRLFGLSSMAPLQVQLLQALSGAVEVVIYLLTPCRDLWQRQEDPAAWLAPLGEDWLLQAPRLEARFGRMGADFQQLLEGSGETQLGVWEEADLFFAAARSAAQGSSRHEPRAATLLEQLQQRLVDPLQQPKLQREANDSSLEFHACPGRLRQLQIVRDRVLQLMADDPSLQPRDILIMTPQVEAFAPLVGAVFGDSDATAVTLPWRLTDRSQQSEAGISAALLALLALGGERLTATALEALLSCTPLLAHHQISPTEVGGITALLQRTGFRWGLDGQARGGDPTHSLAWAIDRLLLGLVLPEQPGLAPAETAPLAMGGSLEQQGRWLLLLGRLRRALGQLAQPRTPAAWAPLLRQLLADLFGEGGDQGWELQAIQAAIAHWRAVAAESTLELEAPVVAEVLAERLSADSGRFGHRSGALTISALEPMRAIPHRLIVLMGLDAGVFPRQRERPGFHLLEQQRQLGDPSPGDQDRYVLLESLLSARQHLLISWSSRDERTGEPLQPATPVRQWLDLLQQELASDSPGAVPLREHSPNPLERSNFLAEPPWPPASCDLRLLRARQHLEQPGGEPPLPLALAEPPALAPTTPVEDAYSDLQAWRSAPQDQWLRGLGMRPREWGQAVDDLEALALDERQRAELLRQQLQRHNATDPDPDPDPDHPPDWCHLQRGTGVLPPGSAALLEARQLERRWQSLHTCLEQLGQPRQELARHDDLCAELHWRGEALVLSHSAKLQSRHRLTLWLELLLAAAASLAPRQGVLIGRDGEHFRVVSRISPPPPSEARQQLEQLRHWREQHRSLCWPVPPDTGWAFAQAERKQAGSGLAKARGVWEGGYAGLAEREREVMAVCFGSSLPTSELLHARAMELAIGLFDPLLERSEEARR